ncbi:MAG: YggT family protein [Massilia sp.]
MFGILEFIVNSVAYMLGGVLLLRFWMQAVRVRAPAREGHFIFTLSDWLVRPMRRVIPGVGGYDWASLIGALLVIALASSIFLLRGLSLEGVALLTLFRFLTWPLYGFWGLLVLEVVFSWINPNAPMAPFVRALNDPLSRPVRRLIPPLGGMDFSPMVIMLLLYIALRLVEVAFGISSV